MRDPIVARAPASPPKPSTGASPQRGEAETGVFAEPSTDATASRAERRSASGRTSDVGRPARGRGRLWLMFHRWLGLPVWAFLFFVCATGTIASVSREIAWLVDPRVRALNPDDRPHVGYDVMTDAVRRAYPDAEILWVHEDEPYLTAFVGVSLPDAVWGTAYVNPYTAEVQGLTKGLNFPEFMRELHAWLLLPWRTGTSIGYYLVGAMGLVLMGLIVTGFKVHKRIWRTIRQPRLRTDRGARVWWGDLHRIVGAWALWFAATMSVTGIWFLTQGILWDTEFPLELLPPELARDDMPVVRNGDAPPERIGFDAVAAAARSVAPDLEITWLVPPATPYGTIEVLGEDGPAIMGDYATAVFVDPWTGEVIESHPVGELGPLGALDHAADPLHYGNFAGLWSRLIWFVFGSGLSALVFSGMMVWMKRTARAPIASSSNLVPPSRERRSRARGVVDPLAPVSAISRANAVDGSDTDRDSPLAEPAGPRVRWNGRGEAT